MSANSGSGIEFRANSRAPLEAPAEIQLDDFSQPLKVMIANLSLGGMFISIGQPPAQTSGLPKGGKKRKTESRRRHLRRVLLVFYLWCQITQAQTDVDALSMSAEREMVLIPVSSSAGLRAGIDELSVVYDGRPQEILGLRPLTAETADKKGHWRFVLYVDPAFSTPSGIEQAATVLKESVATLVSLGTVEIVVADPFADSYLEASRDRAEVVSVLEELEDLADGAGEILALRQELLELRSNQGLDRESLETAWNEEIELLDESRLELLRWLSQTATTRPSCLILVQDGYDLTADFFESLSVDLSEEYKAGLAHGTQAHGRLAATLAAAGWTVVPLSLGVDHVELIPGRVQALTALAESSGGDVVVEGPEIPQILNRLGAAIIVSTRIRSSPDGLPRRVEVRSTAQEGAFRTAQWATVATPIALTEIRALQTLQEPDLIVGPWPTSGIIRPDPEAGPMTDGFAGVLEALTELPDALPEQAVFRVSVMLVQMEGMPQLAHRHVSPTDLSGAEAWLYRQNLQVTEDLAAGAVVVEELMTGNWGSAPLELTDRAMPTQGMKVAVWEAKAPPRNPARARTPRQQEQAVIRVLPPKKRPVVGRTRFETLVSSPIIERVTFLVDGEEVGSDDKAPFSVALDMGSDVDMRTVEVVAFAANGARLGSHQITVNPKDDSFQVRITEVASPLGGIQTITAEVRVPGDAELDRVEFYWNETLVKTQKQAPFAIELPVPDSGVQAIVRVAAYLEDGTWIDDAQLLGDAAISERLEVNLVELHVVVTDRDDKPVEGLTEEDFNIRFGRREMEIQRLAFAEDVPLTLGVVIDTSESMWSLMVETQKAGAQFVANTLADGDSAFLVDFDTQPRLAQDTTTDVLTLLKTFGRFQPDGYTALYDAVIFSMLQFEEADGRKALVLLTDGDDYKSRYGPRRCIQYGQRLGVPVYIISLAGVHNSQRNLRRIDLEGITEGTGGQVFYIKELSELNEAYDTINRELRSQYILTFATDRELSEIELEEIEVEVEGKGLLVRGVVGGQNRQ